MDIIIKYFPELNEKQKEQFIKLGELYKKWNNDINVISRKDIPNLYEHHILHSLSIAKVIRFKSNTKLMDVGTGGGLPGIPLAIYFPECQFYLVDSIGKKIKVVNEIIRELNLINTKADQIRAENVDAKFDFILSRAVTNLPDLYKWTKDKITPPLTPPQLGRGNVEGFPNGIICLKGGDLSSELNLLHSLLPTPNSLLIYNIQDYFSEDYFKDKKIVIVS